MIAWMQKHNKYLVVTIWIATIAFIGAGFVGWGTYQYGSKAGAIAKVGNVMISQEKFNFTYQNLYRRYAEMAGGNFDDKKAKEAGLPKEAYRQLVTQALLLNLAGEYGVMVSERELADAIVDIPAFQEKGVFNRKVYMTFLNSRGMKAKSFEAILKDDLKIEKLMRMLNKGSVPFETDIISSAFGVKDRIDYQVLTVSDLNVSTGGKEREIRIYWEKNRDRYRTKRIYRLSILWTDLSDLNASMADLREFYRKNSFNYTDAGGKELDFEKARSSVERDYRIKKGKKKALLDYIALKKGRKKVSETVDLPENDPLLPQEVWQKIKQNAAGDIIKPKPVGGRYATVMIEKVIPSREMSYREARTEVESDWLEMSKKKALEKAAVWLLKSGRKLGKSSGYLSLAQSETLEPLSQQESLQFLQKLFTSDKKEGIIEVHGKKIIYRITGQKMEGLAAKEMKKVKNMANRIKKAGFEQALLHELSGRYPVKSFVKGF
jgi:peptidyl-prolyl cis-trans isomerase D